METNLGSFQRTAQSTGSLEWERRGHQRYRGDSGTQTASNLQGNSPVRILKITSKTMTSNTEG